MKGRALDTLNWNIRIGSVGTVGRGASQAEG